MEITSRFLILFCAFSVLIIWAWRVLNWVWLRPKRLEKCLRKQGLNGNSYKLFSGDLKERSKMMEEARLRPIKLSDDFVPRVLSFVDKTVKKYGKNIFTWIGPVPTVYITEPELIKEIMSKNFQFIKTKPDPLTSLLATGLVTYEGEQWAKHRKITKPAFHQEKLKHMLPAFYLSCKEMMTKWENLITIEGSCELDVSPFLNTLTADGISRTAFGSSYEEGTNIFQLQDEQAELVMKGVQSVYIPGWRFLPTKANKRMKEIDRQVQDSLRGIIDKKLKAMKEGEASSDDLLGIMLESNLKEIEQRGNNKKVGISIQEVIEECKLIYFAGQGTTSSLLVWSMILLSIHQDWQQRAREEVLEVFGSNKPDFDGLNNLKVVTMIVYEVLRLYPPIILLERAIHEDIKLGEMLLPAGVQISLPTILLHHDREIWGADAKEFKPERFSEGVSKATKSPVSFFSFGWGPRVCIGQNFAMLEAKIAVAMILQSFSFELSPSYTHAPSNVATLQPQHGAHVILHKL